MLATGVLTTLAAIPSAYLGVLTLFGLPRCRRRPVSRVPASRFAIVVPAHNEAVGIGATLDSFRALDYPSDLYSVHVVADNCTDDTAAVVGRHGWSAHERFAPDDPGKGPALNWVYDRLVADSAQWDALVVVDADTSLDPAFLRAMDAALQNGGVALQGYYGVRDAEATAGTAFRSAALACRHHLRPLARRRLGASCGLYGNGMAFRRDILHGRRWSGHLVEDAEFQMDLLLSGHLVTYVPGAELRAEMPHDNPQSTTQNERWERGRIDLCRRYLPVLVRRALDERRHRVAMVDAALDHLVPPVSVLAGVHVVATGLAAAGTMGRRRWARRLLMVNVSGASMIAAHVLAGLYAVAAPRATYRHLLSAPRIALWKVALWARVLVSPYDATWVRTGRNDERTA
jgi:cellulose synthase/poly-beta-1,6-N-acetylglucosamine synthase-like glycosyltransferase